jgi:hypothetical protein
MESEEAHAVLNRAGLTWRARCILNLRECGADLTDIAEVLGATPDVIEQEAKRARRKVRAAVPTPPVGV